MHSSWSLLGAVDFGLNAANSTNTMPRYPVVKLGYASYQGIYNEIDGINSWYGIRYAQPPVGDLRWQAPKDIEAKNTYQPSMPINATVIGPGCVQGSPPWLSYELGLGVVAITSEDCLLLDVKVPSKPASESLPVMVQIHGGGYTLYSAEVIAPGDSLVYQSNGNLIYVSIQYRLGAYGFLGGVEVANSGAPNVGLLDQRAALQWVQRHISAFGGDPQQVTIVGGSAGGGSVMNQMILYGGVANPPFKAVIAEYPWWQTFHTPTMLQTQYNILLQASGCSDITCLRSLPEADLMKITQQSYVNAYQAGFYGFGDFYYGPYVDGSVVQNLPSLEFAQGHFTHVPLLTNREGYEGVLFSNLTLTTQTEALADLKQVWPEGSPSFFTRLFQIYQESNYNSTFYQRQSIFGDAFICCPTYQMATAVSNTGLPVYKMLFDAGSQLHGALISFTYGSIPGINTLAFTPNNQTLAAIIRDYYLSFAIHGNPNTQAYSNLKPPYWPMYMADSNNFQILDVNYNMIGPNNDPDAGPQCDFFKAQGYAIRS